MAGGTVNQAKRRSVDNNASRETTTDTSLHVVDGISLQLVTPQPTQAELLVELSKKRVMDLTIPQKLEKVVRPLVDNRDMIVNKAKAIAPQLGEKISKAIPVVLPTTISGPKLADMLLAMHTSIKAYIEATNRPPRQVLNVFENVDKCMKMAVSNVQSDHQSKQHSCFPVLSWLQKSRKYLKDGFKPTDKAHTICIGCGHSYVDEPNANKELEAKYERELRVYEQKKKEAKDEASRTNSSVKRISAPKLSMPYRQCHCSQLFCVNVGSRIGSSCPIDCKQEDGSSCGVDELGACKCPICKCQCSLAFTYNAAQIVRTRQLLDENAIAEQEEINVRKSGSVLNSLLTDATNTTLAAAIESGKQFSRETLQSMSMTSGAQAIAANFNAADHPSLVRSLRKEIGMPTTKVRMPVAITVNGKSVQDVDTRALASSKANHRKMNNKLTPQQAGQNSMHKPAKFPLQPYKDSYEYDPGIRFFGNENNNLTEEEALEQAKAASLNELTAEDIELARAIKASRADNAISIDDDSLQSARGSGSSGANNLIVLLSPHPPPKSDTTVSTTKDAFLKRVEKKAFKRSQLTTELFEPDNPTATPTVVSTSPYAARVFHAMSDRTNQPAVANYVSHYHEENPLADSQDAYEQVNGFMRTLNGDPKKKRSKKRRT